MLEVVPSATELRKTVPYPQAGDTCAYGKVLTALESSTL